MKVAAKVYKGIEFIGIDELPSKQQVLLSENKTIERIKILIDGKIVSNCVQYQHYTTWYSTTFETQNNVVIKTINAPSFDARVVAIK